MCSRGKTYRAAGELVFFVNNPAVFLRKILGLFAMAKRQNSSMQPDMFSHSAHFYVKIKDFWLYVSIFLLKQFQYLQKKKGELLKSSQKKWAPVVKPIRLLTS